MARPEPARRLVVNADDFGLSTSVNQAVIRAHNEGILTTASLMVNEPGCAEAVALAHENPRLGVGLHLSLLCGRSALPPEKIPGLVNSRGEFSNNPVATGFRYFAMPGLRAQIRAEIRAQLERFRATGLVLDHVNGHLHLHLHPVILPMLMAEADAFGIRRVRLTRDPFWFGARLSAGRWFYRAIHAFIYLCLSARARPELDSRGIRHTRRVFGLLENARVDETYLARLLPLLPSGDSELYSHPSLGDFKHEFDALVSPRVTGMVRQFGIQLIRYQDL
jgi:hopanoid biosynthesis associated protein HpnK